MSLGWAYKGTNLGVHNFVTTFLKRNGDILGQVQVGHALPILCAPTHEHGMITPAALVTRLTHYEAAKVPPSPYDMTLALLRLDAEGRDDARAGLRPDNEMMRALTFALGGEMQIGKTKWLWVAAAAARNDRKDTPRIAKLSGVSAPDVGCVARYQFVASCRKSVPYSFPQVRVRTTPPIKKMLPNTYLTGLFHLTTVGAFNGSVSGHQADDIRWAGTLWPQNLEPFFAQGICLFDAAQKLSNSPFAAFVEPILTARTALGPMGHNLLALYLASTDGAVRGLAVEGLITCIERDLLDVETFAGATRRLIADARFPATRWRRSFAQVAKVTPHHAQQIAAILT